MTVLFENQITLDDFLSCEMDEEEMEEVLVNNETSEDIISSNMSFITSEAHALGGYLNKIQNNQIPQKYIIEVLLSGSGFVNGKKRIFNIVKSESNNKDKIDRIRKEYGLGGASWPMQGKLGLHGYDSYSAKGLKINWVNENGENEGIVSWNKVFELIKELIEEELYISRREELKFKKEEEIE